MFARIHRRNAGAIVRATLAVLALGVIVTGRAPGQTQTATWTGATGNWDSPTIWTTSPQAGFFPNNDNPAGSIYNVTASGSGTISLDVPIVVNQLTFGSGTISGPSDLTINGGLTWSGTSTLSGAGATTTVGGGSTLGSSGMFNQTLTLGRNLTLNGDAFWNPGFFQSIDFVTGSGATLTIGSGTTFLDSTGSGSSTIRPTGADATGLAVVNNGHYVRLSNGQTNVTVPFNNNNLVTVQNGTLSLNAGGSSATGTYLVDSNGTLNFNGVPYTVRSLFVDNTGGTIGGTANVTVTSSFELDSGALTGAGATTTVTGTTQLFATALTLGRNLTLNGNASLNVGTTISLTSGSGATLMIGAGATFTDNGTAGTFIQASGASATGLAVINNGTYVKTGVGGSSTLVSVPFTNAGTVSVLSNELAFASGAVTNLSGPSAGATLTGGAWSVGGSGTLSFTGTTITTNAATVILNGPNSTFAAINGLVVNNGNFSLQGGSVFTTAGNLTNAGTLDVQIGSTLVVNGDYLNNGMVIGAGTIGVNNATFAGGNINNTGTLAVAGTLTVTGATSLSSGAVNVAGATAVNSSFTVANGATLGGAGGVSLPSGSSLTVNGTVASAKPVSVAGMLQGNGTAGVVTLNDGALLQGNGGTLALTALVAAGSATIQNSVTVSSQSTVTNGTLTIAAGATLGGTGSLNVNAPGTLVVQGTVGLPTTVAGVLSGNANMTNSVVIQPGGFIRPGNSPGKISVGGSLTLNGSYDWDLAGNDNTMAGGTFDQVAVAGGTTLDPPFVNPKFGSGVDFASSFWAKPATWPILTTDGGFTPDSILPTLSLDPADIARFRAIFPRGSFSQTMLANSLNVVWDPGAARQYTWTGNVSGNWTTGGNWATGVPISDISTQLLFGAALNTDMINDFPGPFILNAMTFNAGSPAYSLGGSGLDFRTNSAGDLPRIATNSSNNVTINVPIALTNNLTVVGTGNLTLNGVIGGAGSLTVAGAGTLVLNGINTYSGGTNVQSGTLQVAADSGLGTGNVTGAALGTLSFIGSTATTRSFAMNGGTIAVAAGQTVTFSGGPVSGAILDGAGTFATSPATGAQFVGVTTAASVAVTSNNAADQFMHVVNNGALTVAAGVNSSGASTTVNFNGFTNQGTGSVTIGAGSQVNMANFQSYGTVTLPPATGSQPTQLTNLGTAPLGFNGGSRTFIGTPSGGSFKAGVDLHGQNLIVSGGLFVNNGFVADSTANPGHVIVDYGALYKGAGSNFVSIVTQNGGRIQAGNSPGAAAFGDLTIGPGGINNFGWQINDAGPSLRFPNAPGRAGPSPDANNNVSGWSQLQSKIIVNPITHVATTGDFTWTATNQPGNQFELSLETLLGPYSTVGTSVGGRMADFDSNGNYDWPLITWQGTYTGPTDSATLTADTLIDTSQFQNSIGPTGKFVLFYDGVNKSINLTTAPEPGTLALGALGGLGIVWSARRRRAKTYLTPPPSPQ